MKSAELPGLHAAQFAFASIVSACGTGFRNDMVSRGFSMRLHSSGVEVFPAAMSTLAVLLTILLFPSPGCAATRALFNGKNLDGWQQIGPGTFVVEGGVLKTVGGMGLLWYTREKLANATVHVVFKMGGGPKSDSGVFIRIPVKPTDPWMAVNHGYEIEIGNWPDDYSCTGAIYTFSKALARPIKPVGKWNTMDITLDGPRTVVYLNGVKVTDYYEGQPVPPKHPGSADPDRGPRLNSGYIGLQNEPGGTVFFREVSVKPLR